MEIRDCPRNREPIAQVLVESGTLHICLGFEPSCVGQERRKNDETSIDFNYSTWIIF